MAIVVTACIVIITVYTIMGFKNIKTIRDDIKKIHKKQECHCKTKHGIKKEEVEEYEEDESEN